MDKILSAEEWRVENYRKNRIWRGYMVNEYSSYLLEAFAEDVKSEAKIKLNPVNSEQTRFIVDPQSIDQLLTNFKEKL
jgi:hypothetical protein